jgi:hypothetical protein
VTRRAPALGQSAAHVSPADDGDLHVFLQSGFRTERYCN